MNATKKLVTILGVVFLVVGIAGFFAPHLGGAHLSVAHNIIHLVSGVLAIYFGTAGSYSGARAFSFVFGAVYGLLGVAGFIAGAGSERMLNVIPGQLELGTADHILHVALGIIFLILGFAARPIYHSSDQTAAST
jgi:uncharacterized membrane protein HdeD (DUF308 family)